MASRPFPNLSPGFGRNALDFPVAALAAIAVAFFAFAMPGDLMTRLVEATGLPSVLSAAAPPLGMKARLGIGLIGAVGAFGLVFLLLRLLDRTGIEPRRARPVAEVVEFDDEEEEAPRLRRRDFHPDAPSRRPISAVRDLGEPAPPQPPIPLPWPEAPPPSAWEEEAETEAPIEPAPIFPVAAEPAAAFPDAAEPTPAFPAPAELLPECPDAAKLVPEPVFADEPEPARKAELPADIFVSPVGDQPDEPRGESLEALVARLEQGLARRARSAAAPAPAPAAPPVEAPPPQPFAESGDDRLKSAIESLQRFAARD